MQTYTLISLMCFGAGLKKVLSLRFGGKKALGQSEHPSARLEDQLLPQGGLSMRNPVFGDVGVAQVQASSQWAQRQAHSEHSIP